MILKRFFVAFIVVLIGSIVLPTGEASAKTIKFRAYPADSIPTNVQGTSITTSPNINVFRSKRGATYFINKFNIKSLASNSRIRALRKQLRSVNYKTNMVILVMTEPMDNYQINIRKVELENDIITINVVYRHEMKDYRIPPKKAYYYYMITIKQMPQPVMIDSKQTNIKKNAAKKTKAVTVTGRLMLWKESAYQIIPVKIRRGSKNSYYIRGEKMLEELKPYLGMVVTIKGTVSHEKDGPYENELTVTKVIKANDK